MFSHHIQAIETVTAKLKKDERILGIIVGGSIAHGFSSESSDVDLMLVLSDSDYQLALEKKDLHYFETESAAYEDGYVEGKYISSSFIEAVIEKGTEPARFAFNDAFITYSTLDNLEQLVSLASAYPVKEKEDKMQKFHAQFEGWKWMFHEGQKRKESYVINFSIVNLVLFGGRLLLAHNEVLYPYHKWFMRVLGDSAEKPTGIIEFMNRALSEQSEVAVEELYQAIKNFRQWPEYDKGWLERFILDSEINWMYGTVPIADL
jgi:predicted nucleotidyltransferase